MSSSDAVQKQWDVSATSIASSQKLLELIAAASEDNVQPQAVLALCALGSIIHPSPELIGTAVDALGGTKNVKLENLKLAIGLRIGGTALHLRQTTPGLAVFLLICALKLWHIDNDVGIILHRMAVKSGVISRWPASSQQFCDAVDAVAGHAGTILPVNHLCEIGSAILSAGIDDATRQVLYKEISTEALADILTHTFTSLQNADVKRVSLNGATSAMWLIAILTWIIPDTVCVVAGGCQIIGPQESRVVIELGLPITTLYDWEIVEWKRESSLQTLISAGSELVVRTCASRMVTKHRFQSLYKLSASQTSIIGHFAGAVLRLFVECGSLFHGGIGKHLPTEVGKTPVTSLLEVAGTWFCEEYPTIMLQYG